MECKSLLRLYGDIRTEIILAASCSEFDVKIKRSIIKLDLTKPLTTNQGHPVRILATDVVGWRTYRPNILNGINKQERELRHDIIIGLVRKPDGTDETRRWTPEGFEINEDQIHDLVQAKVKKWRWAINTELGAWVSPLWTEKQVLTYTTSYGFILVGRILESEIEE